MTVAENDVLQLLVQSVEVLMAEAESVGLVYTASGISKALNAAKKLLEGSE